MLGSRSSGRARIGSIPPRPCDTSLSSGREATAVGYRYGVGLVSGSSVGSGVGMTGTGPPVTGGTSTP